MVLLPSGGAGGRDWKCRMCPFHIRNASLQFINPPPPPRWVKETFLSWPLRWERVRAILRAQKEAFMGNNTCIKRTHKQCYVLWCADNCGDKRLRGAANPPCQQPATVCHGLREIPMFQSRSESFQAEIPYRHWLVGGRSCEDGELKCKDLWLHPKRNDLDLF